MIPQESFEVRRNKAIVIAVKRAKILQRDYPQIAFDYDPNGNDMFAREIVDKYDFVNVFNISGKNAHSAAVTAVQYAIRGQGFPGLIDKEVLREITKGRRQNNLDDWVERNGGKTGFALLSDERMKEISKNAALGRGDVSYLSGEEQFAYELSQNSEYHEKRGVSWKLVAERINRDLHDGREIRTPKAVKCMVYKYKVNLKKIN